MANGLVGNVMGQSPMNELPVDTSDPNKVFAANTQQLGATTRSVDPAKETVAGQLQSILSAGSPYIQSARTSAAETANSRGLLNSSMAAGAGEAAAIDRALPIAQADAGTYSQVANQNQAYENNASQFNASATNATNLNTANNANALIQQQLKGSQSTQLANIEAQYKELMQASASASSYYNTVTQNITNILNDPNSSQAQKQAAVDHQTALLSAGLNLIGQISNVDLTSLLDFTNLPKATP